MDDMTAVKVLKNALCFIMVVFGSHGNTCYVILIGALFCMMHSIGPVNVCNDFEIKRYKIDEFRKHAKIVFYLTSRDAKTVRRTTRTSWGWILLIYISIRNIL